MLPKWDTRMRLIQKWHLEILRLILPSRRETTTARWCMVVGIPGIMSEREKQCAGRNELQLRKELKLMLKGLSTELLLTFATNNCMYIMMNASLTEMFPAVFKHVS